MLRSNNKLAGRIAALLSLIFAGEVFAVPVEDLYRAPRERAAYLSPDGSRLAVIAGEGDIRYLDIIELADASRTTVFSTEVLKADESTISRVSWIDNQRVMFSVYELVEGVAKLSDTRNVRRLFFTDVTDPDNKIRFLQSKGLLLSALPNEPDSVLFSVSGSKSYVYKIRPSLLNEWGYRRTKTSRVDNGQVTRTNRVAQIDGIAMRWVADTNGDVRAAMRMSKEGVVAMLVREPGVEEWSTLREWDLDEMAKGRTKARKEGREEEFDELPENTIYFPSAIIDNSQDFVVIKNDDDDRQQVIRYDYETGAETVIYENDQAEIVDISLSYDGQSVQEVSYFEDGAIKFFYPDSRYQDVQAELASRYSDYSVQVASSDAAGATFVAHLSSSVQPGRVMLYRPASGEVLPLYDTKPWLDESALRASTPGTVNVDDVDIEYFLTKPTSDSAAPLVVSPHGGPVGVRDLRVFDPQVQALAAAGFAVLQVNFRGSSGYGSKFEDSGRGEFGDKILIDIESAIDAVVADPAVDASRICIAGGSYGGYAALMLPTRSPGRYRCSVAHAAPTDLGLLVASSERRERVDLQEFLIGEQDDEDIAYDKLKRLSPVYQATAIDAPVLLSHGRKDTVVDLEHGLRLKLALERRGQPIEWIEYPDEGHSFSEIENAIAYNKAVIAFLTKHLQP
ncbi:MAG: prolyl oligopeptidase family serine peptidase [Pseudomonadota bacterium]